MFRVTHLQEYKEKIMLTWHGEKGEKLRRTRTMGPDFLVYIVELQNDVNHVPAICCTLALISLRTEASTIARLIFKMEM